MRRREFLLMASGATASWSLTAHAQQSGPLRQVGVLYPGPKSVAQSRIASILSGLLAGGMPSDKLTIVTRVTDGDPTLLQPMAADLVDRKVDLIMALGPTSLRAARAATTSIPIVAGDLESDPLSTGFIAENRRPGGNVTGLFLDFPDFSKKWLQAAAAAELNLTLALLLEVRVSNDLEHAFQSAKDQRPLLSPVRGLWA